MSREDLLIPKFLFEDSEVFSNLSITAKLVYSAILDGYGEEQEINKKLRESKKLSLDYLDEKLIKGLKFSDEKIKESINELTKYNLL